MRRAWRGTAVAHGLTHGLAHGLAHGWHVGWRVGWRVASGVGEAVQYIPEHVGWQVAAAGVCDGGAAYREQLGLTRWHVG